MATYNELEALPADPSFGALMAKINVATSIKAAAIIDAPSPTANAIAWASTALVDPSRAAANLLWYVLATNAGASTAQILAANDAAVQSAVNAAVDALHA